MKYISIDIETTGLDPEKHQILEFAAVYDDLENLVPIENLPIFVRQICWDDFVISRHCLQSMHQGLIQEILDTNNGNVITIDKLSSHFRAWLSSIKVAACSSGVCNNYNVAGKNFAGFDGLFLKKIPNFLPWFYRVIDVGSMYLTFNMPKLPSLDEIVGKQVRHRALDDALDVVRAIRNKLLPKANQGYGHGLSTM